MLGGADDVYVRDKDECKGLDSLKLLVLTRQKYIQPVVGAAIQN